MGANYCNALGIVASQLIARKVNGYMARVSNLCKPVDEWSCGAIPITMLMNMEIRHGKPTPVIKKSLVNMTDPALMYFLQNEEKWALNDCYRYVGPRQFFGPREITDIPPMTTQMNKAAVVQIKSIDEL